MSAKTAGALAALVLAASCASAPSADAGRAYYAGADLSWVNELEDCGAEYRVSGELRDPYELFVEAGLNIVRLRIWVDPQWTDYSTRHDVARSMRRAKSAGAMVLLDFHYSDTWADPGQQTIPAAWAEDIDDAAALAQHMYDYTAETLTFFGELGLMPHIVQVGNEINSQMLRPVDTPEAPIEWPRQAELLDAGVEAVRDMAGRYDVSPKVMLHVAQPENVEPWLEAATAHGVTDYDFIGISYYPRWSEQSIDEMGDTIERLRAAYDAEVIVVETGYGWLPGDPPEDNSENSVRVAEMLEPGYPATIEGQRAFLVDVAEEVRASDGVGVLTWEPAAVGTLCNGRLEGAESRLNFTLFDPRRGNELLPGADYLRVVRGERVSD